MAKSPSANGSQITVEDLSDQITVLKKDIATLTETLGDYGKAKSDEMRDTARTAAQDLSDAGRLKAMDAQKQAEEFLQSQPGTALGIAAGLGFLVGIVTARR
ncbi:YqjD family protein [Sulfitobacter sp. PS-8MA]|uniref:YqjD family protein n=1 Tax=Sulfitobacter sp. PS-8MA TaxID=3237707 RepID=UPI0034C65AAF